MDKHKLRSVAREGLVALTLSMALFFLVLYPNIPLALKQIDRQRIGVDLLANSSSPAMVGFADRVEAANVSPEWYIDDHIKYASDFDVWGNFDYWETPDEVLQQGRTDCEGKAVLAKAVYNILNEKRAEKLKAEILSQQHHVYVEVTGPKNKTTEAYKIPEKPKESQIDIMVRGFIEFVNELPLLRQAMLGLGLLGIWGRYVLNIRIIFRKR